MEGQMKAPQLLHNFGQSIWLDNITCDLLESCPVMEGAKDERRKKQE
jgi:hypothetical protein